MIRRPKIAIFTKGSPQLGFGHIKRSSDLADLLSQHGNSVSISGLTPLTRTHIPAVSEPITQPDIVVIDSPVSEDELVLLWQKRGAQVLGLDYYGKATPELSVCVYPHSDTEVHGNRIADFKFAMIRPEIRRAGQNISVSAQSCNHVVICLGGCDTLGLGPEIAIRLAKQKQKPTLVVGPLARKLTAQQKHALDSKQIKVLFKPRNFVEVLSCSDWAVTSGGGTMFETLHLGLPTWVSPQTPREHEIAAQALEQKAILGVGPKPNPPSAEDQDALRKRARSTIDGHGLERIRVLIDKLSQHCDVKDLLIACQESHKYVNLADTNEVEKDLR